MFLQRKKTTAMQRLLHHVRCGYIYHFSGTVEPNSLLDLIEKFSKIYRIDLNVNQRYYRKSKGKANVFFTCYPVLKNGNNVFIWFLLATEGKGKIHELEKLKNVNIKSERLSWLNEYELVKLSKKESKPAFTWQMTNENLNGWIERIRYAVAEKKNNSLMKRAIWSLKRTPGFRGNRIHVKKLFNQLKGDVKRIKSKSFLLDHEVLRNGFVRSMKNDFIDIELAINNINRNEKFDLNL